MESWRLKLNRAEKHLDDLDSEIALYASRNPYFAQRETYCDRHNDCWRYTLQIREEPPVALALILGDAVHNMRSAIDHLAVAISDAKYRESASFPCFLNDPDKLPPGHITRKAFERATAGMSAEALAEVKRCQPYAESDPVDRRRHILTVISRLDRTDKHRNIVLFSSGLLNAGSRTIVRGQVMTQSIAAHGLAVNGTELAHFGDFFTPPLQESEVQMEIRGTPAISVDVGLDEPNGSELEVSSLREVVADLREGLFPLLESFVRL